MVHTEAQNGGGLAFIHDSLESPVSTAVELLPQNAINPGRYVAKCMTAAWGALARKRAELLESAWGGNRFSFDVVEGFSRLHSFFCAHECDRPSLIDRQRPRPGLRPPAIARSGHAVGRPGREGRAAGQKRQRQDQPAAHPGRPPKRGRRRSGAAARVAHRLSAAGVRARWQPHRATEHRGGRSRPDGVVAPL